MRRLRLRKDVLFASLSVISLLASVIAPIGMAAAESTFQFGLSVNSGRPGLRVEISQIDPCPAMPAEFDYQQVNFTFTDANNVRTASTYYASTDASGTWHSDAILVIPWRDIKQYDPPVISSEAAVGLATIEARCVLGQTGGTMDPDDDITQTSREYAPRSFNVTGSSLEFTMSDTTVLPGTVIHLESSDPCPGSEVHGSIISNEAVSNFFVNIGSDGSWSVDVAAASTDSMTGETTNFPPGKYEVNAFCMTPNGLNTIFYGENVLEVRDPTPPNYVALGDSYSSGEGIEPFEAGTFEPGGNMCHRSGQAYPRLLANDTDLPLDLGSSGFAACSGATTAAITLGNNNEGAQMDKITADTDLITMTIGGNNMKFGEFAKACITKDCSGKASADAIKRIVYDVIPRMEYMLGTIRDRLINLHNSDATVLVVGYPQVVTDEPWQNLEAVGCEWLDGKREATAIRNITTLLNTAIRNEVSAVRYNFHFVSATETDSPFKGHELCRNSFVHGLPYFINVVPFPEEKQRYTFHPNSRGQEAYAELIKRYLTQHPL